MTAIEITLTNMLEFTHSSEHLFKKSYLEEQYLFQNWERKGEGRREGGRKISETACLDVRIPSFLSFPHLVIWIITMALLVGFTINSLASHPP